MAAQHVEQEALAELRLRQDQHDMIQQCRLATDAIAKSTTDHVHILRGDAHNMEEAGMGRAAAANMTAANALSNVLANLHTACRVSQEMEEEQSQAVQQAARSADYAAAEVQFRHHQARQVINGVEAVMPTVQQLVSTLDLSLVSHR